MQPPFNEQLESTLVGTVLADKRMNYDHRRVSSADFYIGAYSRMWSVFCELDEENQPIEVTEVYERLLRDHPDFAMQMSDIAKLTFGVPASLTLKNEIKRLKELAALRTLQKTYADLSERAARRAPLDDLLEETERLIKSIKAEKEADQGAAKSFSDIIEYDVLPRLDKFVSGETVKFPFGFQKLDDATNGGAGLGELIIFGAKPKSGKSALMTQVATRVSLHTPAYYCSREMLNYENAFRVLAQTSNQITMNHFRPNMFETLRDSIAEHARKIQNLQVYFDDKSKTVRQCRREIELLRERGIPVQAAFFDYAQLMRAENTRNKSKADILEEIVYDLKDLATDLELACYVNAQFNREGIDSARPKMSDFAGSSAIEKAGNLILFWTLEQEESDVYGGRKGEMWIEAGRNVAYDEFDIVYKGEHTFFEFI